MPRPSSLNAKRDIPKKNKNEKSAYKPLVPAVEQASKILICLGDSPNFKMSLTAICRQVGVHKSKGYSILNTLRQFGFIEKDPQNKTYFLGSSLIFLSRNVLDNLRYPEIAAPFLDSLARDTNGTSVLGLISGAHVIVIGKSKGNQNIGFDLRLGHRFHITLGAHGKAILAFMDELDRERVLARKKLYFFGEASHTDMSRLTEEIAVCRRLGFAWDVGEVTPGVSVLSAPVFGIGEKVIGCIILIGTFTESRIKEYGPKVANAATQISYKLGAKIGPFHRTPFPLKAVGGIQR